MFDFVYSGDFTSFISLGIVIVMIAGLISWLISLAIRTFISLLKGR